jgi:hypothetical protein
LALTAVHPEFRILTPIPDALASPIDFSSPEALPELVRKAAPAQKRKHPLFRNQEIISGIAAGLKPCGKT